MNELPSARSGKGAFEVATQAVKEAGAIIMAHFQGEMRTNYKGKTHVVTDVDLLAEKVMIALLREEFPSFGIIAEESESIAGDLPYTWIIDPLDGTRNYAYGIPHFCVSLALAQGDEILLGIVYDPLREEFFRVAKGRGAFRNDLPISISTGIAVGGSLVGFDMGYQADAGGQVLALASALWPGIQSVRVMGSAALGLAYVACGRLDIYLHLSLSPWDLAAGILLVKEAGGVVTEIDGKPVSIRSKRIIATNKAIHEDFLRRAKGRT